MLLHRLQAGCETHCDEALPPGLQAGLRDSTARKCCYTVCKPVCETCYKEVCCTVCKPVCETCMKEVCCTTYKECVETCYKDCVKTSASRLHDLKTVQKKCGEWCTEQYCVKGQEASGLREDVRRVLHHLQQRLRKRQRDSCGTAKSGGDCCGTCDSCCFDPCTCQTSPSSGHWRRSAARAPDQICTRKVWQEHTVCEQVPCTTYVKRVRGREGALHRLQEGAATPSSRRCR